MNISLLRNIPLLKFVHKTDKRKKQQRKDDKFENISSLYNKK